MATPCVPVLDIARLRDGSAGGLEAVAAAIGRACRDIGFFYVSHAGVPAELRADVFDAARAFFASTPEVKDAVSLRHSAHNRGYLGLSVEALDPTRTPDFKEAFNIGLELGADDPEVLAGKPFRGVNLWPPMPAFRTTLLAYYDAMLGLGRDLHRAIAVDLGLPQDYFADTFARPLATLRLLHYPAAAAAAGAGAPRDFGAGQHTDYGNITLLATDHVGGLEVRLRDGRWLAAPPIPDTFVCNIGDCLMRWTNDTYVSTPHRVVSPPDRERYSVAFFLDADPDIEVSCLSTCQNEGRPGPLPTRDGGGLSPGPARRHLRAKQGGAPMNSPSRKNRPPKPTKAQDIQQSLAGDIVHGRLRPGTALDETLLARTFGVSRTPIREAIRQLQVSGLVEVKPHRGAVVADMSEEELDDMFSVMAELEALCARWSALSMSGAERRDLRAEHDASATIVREARRDLYIEANDRFHEAVYEGAHSPFLAETTRNVRKRLAPFRRVQFEGPSRLAKSHAEHGHVIDAIERGDACGAEAAMRAHIGVVRNAVDTVTQPRRAAPSVPVRSRQEM